MPILEKPIGRDDIDADDLAFGMILLLQEQRGVPSVTVSPKQKCRNLEVIWSDGSMRNAGHGPRRVNPTLYSFSPKGGRNKQ